MALPGQQRYRYDLYIRFPGSKTSSPCTGRGRGPEPGCVRRCVRCTEPGKQKAVSGVARSSASVSSAKCSRPHRAVNGTGPYLVPSCGEPTQRSEWIEPGGTEAAGSKRKNPRRSNCLAIARLADSTLLLPLLALSWCIASRTLTEMISARATPAQQAAYCSPRRESGMQV